MPSQTPIKYNGKLDRNFEYPSESWASLDLFSVVGGRWHSGIKPFRIFANAYEGIYDRLNSLFGTRKTLHTKDRFNPTKSRDQSTYMNQAFSQFRGIFQPFRKMKRGVTEFVSPYKSARHILRDPLQIFRGFGNIIHAILSSIASLLLIPATIIFSPGIFWWAYFGLQFMVFGSVFSGPMTGALVIALLCEVVFSLLSGEPDVAFFLVGGTLGTLFVDAIAKPLLALLKCVTQIANNLATAIRGVFQIVLWKVALIRAIVRSFQTYEYDYQPVNDNVGIRQIATLLQSETAPFKDKMLLQSLKVFLQVNDAIQSKGIEKANSTEFRELLTKHNIQCDDSVINKIDLRHSPSFEKRLEENWGSFKWLDGTSKDKCLPVVNRLAKQLLPAEARRTSSLSGPNFIAYLSGELTDRFERISNSSQGKNANTALFLRKLNQQPKQDAPDYTEISESAQKALRSLDEISEAGRLAEVVLNP